ncbi:outer membrane lipoprotein carrier protein LolA [Actibacterium sp. 188UL27-1]|uniref:LolA family protein n=1 Tax=Actibacterium sp. 188UL27-1 TaxID=2786961 RepID=UPI001956C569|nr:outer membrane lipoprotein carrier protein LolA [Actibacterium sp. 188UL27-1]MBM7065968.1 outer membrane lipoprotein carrier protein LolA [Actibacterium sp. 188UL27-1]
MKMIKALAAIALWTALAMPALAQKIPLNELSSYLNGLETAKSTFTQVNEDGTISTGTIYIRRPGRVRFEYDPPDNNLVIAGGGQVAVFDPKSNVPPEQYPLKRTPLNLILERNVNLGRAKMVTGHSQDDAKTLVRAQDPEHPEYGNIQLVFTANPTELRQWIITDDSGTQTTVILGELEKGINMQPSLFSITREAQKRGFN